MNVSSEHSTSLWMDTSVLEDAPATGAGRNNPR